MAPPDRSRWTLSLPPLPQALVFLPGLQNLICRFCHPQGCSQEKVEWWLLE